MKLNTLYYFNLYIISGKKIAIASGISYGTGQGYADALIELINKPNENDPNSPDPKQVKAPCSNKSCST